MHLIVKSADSAFMIVSNQCLFSDKLPFPAAPIAVVVGVLWMFCCHAIAIAVHAFFDLARPLVKFSAAMGALDFDLLDAARRSGQSLPFPIARIIATGAAGVLMGVFYRELFAAHGANQFLVAALVVAVVFAAVLVEVDVSALLTWVFGSRNNTTAAASAIDNFGAGIFNLSGHRVSPALLFI